MIKTKQVKKAVDGEQRQLGGSRMSELSRLAERGRPGDDDVPQVLAPISGRKTQDVGHVVLSKELGVEPTQFAVATETQGNLPVGVWKAGRDRLLLRGREEHLAQRRGPDGDRNGLDDLDFPLHSEHPTKPVNIGIII